jgi:hypothetical protein
MRFSIILKLYIRCQLLCSKHNHLPATLWLLLTMLYAQGDGSSSSSSGSSNSSHDGQPHPISSSSSSKQKQQQQWSQEALAAMALSPFAALSLPLAQDPTWRESAAEFGEKLRARMQDVAFSDGFQQKWQQVGGCLCCAGCVLPAVYRWLHDSWLFAAGYVTAGCVLLSAPQLSLALQEGVRLGKGVCSGLFL